jgi:hypothetical protein
MFVFGVAHVLNSLMGGTNIVVRVVQMSWLVVLDDSGATFKTFCTSYNQKHFTKTSSSFGSSKASPVTFISPIEIVAYTEREPE